MRPDLHSRRLGPTDDPECVENTRNPAQDTQTDVDQEIRAASALDEDRHGRDEEGEEVEEDVGRRRRRAVRHGV